MIITKQASIFKRLLVWLVDSTNIPWWESVWLTRFKARQIQC